jgi:hypothetical protein
VKRKELPDLDLADFKLDDDFGERKPKFSDKLSGFSRGVFTAAKFILGLCLLPFVYSSTFAFFREFAGLSAALQGYFRAGVISFLVLYLFIWDAAFIYKRGHRLLEFLFSFIKPLVKVAPYLVPVYAVVIFLLYKFFGLWQAGPRLDGYFMAGLGFSLALHLVFSSRAIRSKKGDPLKANYIFAFSFVYLLNLLLLAAFLSASFNEFSFILFAGNSYQSAAAVFSAVFTQLFL